MAKQLTDRTERLLKLAQGYSRRLNHEYLGVEHVLMAMLDDANCVATFALRSLCDLGKFCLALRDAAVAGPPMLIVGNIPKTPRLKAVLEVAEGVAAGWRHQFIGSEHLIIGIMVEGQSMPAVLLQQHGVTADKLHAAIGEILQLPSSEVTRATTASLAASLIRAAEVLEKLGDDGDADLRLARNGVHDAIRWLSEYRSRTAK